MALSAFFVCAHAGAASANDYLDRRDAAVACGKLRIAALNLLSEQNGRLLSASPDLDPKGWVHPGVINDAFRELQKLTMYFDHDLQQIESEGPARVLACRQLAFKYAYRGGMFVDYVLGHGRLPLPAGARVRPNRVGCYPRAQRCGYARGRGPQGGSRCVPGYDVQQSLFAKPLVQLPQ